MNLLGVDPIFAPPNWHTGPICACVTYIVGKTAFAQVLEFTNRVRNSFMPAENSVGSPRDTSLGQDPCLYVF
jgi:hypothetical protein